MSRKIYFLLGALIVLTLLLGACQSATPEPTEPPAEESVAEEAPETEEEPAAEEMECESQGLPGALEGMCWEEIVEAADGGEVNWWMWGGSEVINRWVNDVVAPGLMEEYNITLNLVPLADATEFVNQVFGEKEAGVDEDGAVSIMWINAENFRTMKEGELLYGPFAEQLPNAEYHTWDERTMTDSGVPTEGMEAPFAQFQSTFAYDMARSENPETIDDLVQWIKDNPGRFTYSAPPDFVGSRFVRTICLDLVGGSVATPFDQELFDEKWPACWDLLNELEPYLWREGETYPESMQAWFDLFAQGEVDMAFNTGQANWQFDIEAGRYEDTIRPFVLEDASYASNTYIAIAYNAPMAPAVVAANHIMSPEIQFRMLSDLYWIPMIDVGGLPDDAKAEFAAFEFPPAILDPAILQANAIPQFHASWYVPVEAGWTENVLLK